MAVAEKDFYGAMDDDFNTRDALAAVFRLTGTFRDVAEGGLSSDALKEFLARFETYGSVLGLFQEAGARSMELLDGLIRLLVNMREESRRSGDYEASDWIRDELRKLGVEVEDTSEGPRWRLS